MRASRCLIAAALLATATAIAPAVSAAPVPADLGERLASGYVSPAMQRWASTTTALHTALTRYCPAPQPAEANAVKAAFGAAVQAWSGIAFLRFGPLVAENRYERIAFWPDPRNIVPRQLGAMVRAADPADLAPDGLYGRSVAVQGLPALEWLLYGDGEVLAAPSGATFGAACALSAAVAANLARIATDLSGAWGPAADFGKQFRTPGPQNNLYRSPQEVAAEGLKALSTGLQFARDVHLAPVLGKDVSEVRPKRAAYWRSDLTTAALAANLAAMREFLSAADFRYGAGEAWIGAQTQSEIARAAGSAGAVGHPFETAAASEDGYRLLTLTALTLKNAKQLVDQDLAAYFGVTIGFNALDGD